MDYFNHSHALTTILSYYLRFIIIVVVTVVVAKTIPPIKPENKKFMNYLIKESEEI